VIVDRDIDMSPRWRPFLVRYMVELREKNGDWRRVAVPFRVYLDARSGGHLVRDTAGGVCYLLPPPQKP
jgi:hypothetical protein